MEIPKKTKMISLFILPVIIFSCAKAKDNDQKLNENESGIYSGKQTYNRETPDTKTYNTRTKEPTLDDQFEVYKYIYSNGNISEADINVLFVEGKKDELQIIIDMSDGQSVEINLINPISLGVIKGMDSYIYTSTSDNNEQINVYFHKGREMMGMTLNGVSVVFMNTPNYKK